MTLNIVADENLPYVQNVLASSGTVTTLPGRQLAARHLQTADVLLVRSVTRVDAALLAGTPVRFVGTATIGHEHVDTAYLQQHGIGFASAPGCNATAAAEYVTSALTALSEQQGWWFDQKTVSIIGCGQVGSRVFQRLTALGAQCEVCDPPLQQQDADAWPFVDLETALHADIVTLHVPLTRDGTHPTFHMLNAERLSQLRSDAILINAARGDVLDGEALMTVARQQPELTLVLDVWPNEPDLDLSLMHRAHIATPHIAGYSLEGKLRGLDMVYQALCRFLGHSPDRDINDTLPLAPIPGFHLGEQNDAATALRRTILAAYDPRRDDNALRRLPYQADRAAFFDYLRKHYPVRREWSATTVTTSDRMLAGILQTLGFQAG